MDHSVVQLLTHPDLYSGIDSDRLLRAIIDVAASAVPEFEPEFVIPEVRVETAGAWGIAGCAVVEFDDVSGAVRAVGWSSPLAGELAGQLAGEKVQSLVDAISEVVSMGPLDRPPRARPRCAEFDLTQSSLLLFDEPGPISRSSSQREMPEFTGRPWTSGRPLGGSALTVTVRPPSTPAGRPCR